MPVFARVRSVPELMVRRDGHAMLAVNPGRRRWLFGRDKVREPASSQARVATIATTCLAQHSVVCRSCGDECEEGAIGFYPSIGAVPLAVVDSNRCNGCGVCVPVCPAAAITMSDPTIAGSRLVGASR